MHRVIHFWRKHVSTVIAQTVGPLEFDDGQGLDSVDAKLCQIGKALEDIQEFPLTLLSHVLIVRIHGIESADVKLINDQVIKRGGVVILIMPGITAGVTHYAIAIGITIEFQFARIRVTLVGLCTTSGNIEAIVISILDAWDKPGPGVVTISQ